MGMMDSEKQMTKKRKFIRDGVFRAELNNFLMRELAEDGYRCVVTSFSMPFSHHSASLAAVSTFAKRRRAQK